MKCIKNHEVKDENGENEIQRVSNAKAQRLVDTGNWHYCSKSAWKARLRKSTNSNKK